MILRVRCVFVAIVVAIGPSGFGEEPAPAGIPERFFAVQFKVDDICLLSVRNLPGVLLADSRSGLIVLADLLDGLSTNGGKPTKELMSSGKLIFAEKGDSARVTLVGRGYYEVTILDGLSRGSTGLVLFAWTAKPDPNGGRLRVGDECTLNYLGLEGVFVTDARSGDATHKLLKEYLTTGNGSVAEMIKRGDVFIAKAGTRAKVTAIRPSSCEVMILDGKGKGRTGLISAEWGKPVANEGKPVGAADRERNRTEMAAVAAFLRSEAPTLAKARKARGDAVAADAKRITDEADAKEEAKLREATAKKKDDARKGAESAADGKLTLAKALLRDGKTERGRQRLGEIVRDYPGTKGAVEAQKLLDGMK